MESMLELANPSRSNLESNRSLVRRVRANSHEFGCMLIRDINK